MRAMCVTLQMGEQLNKRRFVCVCVCVEVCESVRVLVCRVGYRLHFIIQIPVFKSNLGSESQFFGERTNIRI